MSVTVRAFRCVCAKMHCAAGVSVTSRCTCGELLWWQMWGRDKPPAVVLDEKEAAIVELLGVELLPWQRDYLRAVITGKQIMFIPKRSRSM